VSATSWNGDSDRVIAKVDKKEIELVASKEILDEFSKVLGYEEIQNKIRDKNLEMKYAVAKIESLATIVEPKERFTVIKEDPDDNKFLDCAVAGKADFIISQNKHLLKLKEFRGVRIVTPEEFLKKHSS
jgi:putative PIN family toxin of toxin-antitoxin system